MSVPAEKLPQPKLAAGIKRLQDRSLMPIGAYAIEDAITLLEKLFSNEPDAKLSLERAAQLDSYAQKFNERLENYHQKTETEFKQFADFINSMIEKSQTRTADLENTIKLANLDPSFLILHGIETTRTLVKSIIDYFFDFRKFLINFKIYAEVSGPIKHYNAIATVFCAAYQYHNLMKQSLPSKIAKFPVETKGKVLKLFKENTQDFEEVLKKTKAFLANDCFLARYQAFVPERLFEALCSSRDISDDGLIEANAQYRHKILSKVDNKRKALRNLFETIFSKQPSIMNFFKKIIVEPFDFYIENTVEHANTNYCKEFGTKAEAPNTYKAFVMTYYFEIEITEALNSYDYFAVLVLKDFYLKPTISALSQYAEFALQFFKPLEELWSKLQKEKVTSPPPPTSHEEVVAREKLRQKELEYAKIQEQRREAAKLREQKKAAELLHQHHLEREKKSQLEVDAVKDKILANAKNLRGDLLTLWEALLEARSLHKAIKEDDLKQLVLALELPCRTIEGASGGLLITIHKETVSFHHSHEDRAGTLEGKFIKQFQKALENIGITKEINKRSKSKVVNGATQRQRFL